MGEDYVPTSYCLVFGEARFRKYIDELLAKSRWRCEWEEHEGKVYLTVTAPFQLIAMEVRTLVFV